MSKKGHGMRVKASLLILAGWLLPYAAPAEGPPPAHKDVPCGCEVAKAAIEEVLEAVDDGYRFDAYIVSWHGARVLVSAPLTDGHLQVGDELSFMVVKLKLPETALGGGQQLLTLTTFDRPDVPHVPASVGAGVEQATMPIQEVLKAEQDGYQQTVYIGQWHGMRVAVAVLGQEGRNDRAATHVSRPIRSHQPDSTAVRVAPVPGCKATVSASVGRSNPSRSGHSTRTISSRASSQPSSCSAAGPSSRHRSKWCTGPRGVV